MGKPTERKRNKHTRYVLSRRAKEQQFAVCSTICPPTRRGDGPANRHTKVQTTQHNEKEDATQNEGRKVKGVGHQHPMEREPFGTRVLRRIHRCFGDLSVHQRHHQRYVQSDGRCGSNVYVCCECVYPMLVLSIIQLLFPPITSRNSYSGSHGRRSLHLPTTVLALHVYTEKGPEPSSFVNSRRSEPITLLYS